MEVTFNHLKHFGNQFENNFMVIAILANLPPEYDSMAKVYRTNVKAAERTIGNLKSDCMKSTNPFLL